jgi:YgiT-type zinc finger domain-containing protein
LRCAVCKKGETKQGKSVFRLTEGNLDFVFKNIPAAICKDCGEEYINEENTKLVLQKAHESFENKLDFNVQDWDKLY